MPRLCLLWTTVVVAALLFAVSPAPGTPGGTTAAPDGRSRLANSDWLTQARTQVARAEYHFSATPDGAWSAPNRAQGLRLRADEQGVQLSPRKRDKSSWDLGLTLRGFGRTGAVAPAGRASVHATGERVEQRRDDLGLTEWYVNNAGGIEQGYTIDAPPAGGEDGAPVVLEIATSGSLHARPNDDGAVSFATQNGETALLYQGLMAVDASGEAVESTLAIIPGALRISVHDQGHAYPIIVDPTVVTAAWTADGDQFDERFGASVAGAGDVNGDGHADLIVGAYLYDNGEFDEGKVFIFYGSTGTPSVQPSWSFEPNQTGAWFGYSVAGAGDVNGDGYADVIVGAPLYDNVEVDEGRAFVFLGSPGGPGAAPAWTAEINQNGARFGTSVAGAGDVNRDGVKDVIVGAPLYDNAQNTDEGSAYVYLGSIGTGLSHSAAWTAGSGLFSSGYGTSVASAGDLNADGYGDIIVGAPLYDAGGFFDEGRVFFYPGGPAGPSAGWTWIADGNKSVAKFGQSVAAAGDVNGDGFGDLIIGAPTYDSGRVFVFHGSATGPSLAPNFMAKNTKGSADLGTSVAGAGDMNGDGFADVVVGAPRTGDAANPNQGSVRVYFGSKNGLPSQPAFTVAGTQANSLLGGSVAGAGDVNGDGFSDVIAGGIGLDNAAQFVANSGGAALYLGFRTRQTSAPLSVLHGVRFSD